MSVADKQHTIDELSSLFDEIDVEKNLDTEDSSENLRPFSDRCKDVKAVMEDESVVENVAVIENVIEDIVEIENEPKIKPAPLYFSQSETIPESQLDPIEQEPQAMSESNESNPLGLHGVDLKAYHKIKQKHPEFILHDGTQAFKDFYRFKVRVLKSLLTNFPVLDIKDMNGEIERVNLKYQGASDLPDPVAIGIKMGECNAARGRVTHLISKAQMQLPAWKKCFEWLNSKLWKDHESKGAHKREGLAADHNFDVQRYYTDLQGFIDGAVTVDGFLKATHDSVSRQLTCVMIRDQSGLSHDHVESELNNEINHRTKQTSSVVQKTNSSLDNLDVIEDGTVIEKARVGGLVQKDFPGAEIEDDLLSDIG